MAEVRQERAVGEASVSRPTSAVGTTVIIGCGNLLRGDDAIGPLLIRELFEEGYGDSVVLVDGGTAGMDIAFKMRGASRVIMVDACRTDAPPGTVYRVPGQELEHLPDVRSFQSHTFRWDHALAFARWLLDDGEYPAEVGVYLVAVDELGFGDELSTRARRAMAQLKLLIKREIGVVEDVTASLSASGCLHLPLRLTTIADRRAVSVGARLEYGVLDLFLLVGEVAGRPLKVIDSDGTLGVELGDLVGVRHEQTTLSGINDRERGSLHFVVEGEHAGASGDRP